MNIARNSARYIGYKIGRKQMQFVDMFLVDYIFYLTSIIQSCVLWGEADPKVRPNIKKEEDAYYNPRFIAKIFINRSESKDQVKKICI